MDRQLALCRRLKSSSGPDTNMTETQAQNCEINNNNHSNTFSIINSSELNYPILYHKRPTRRRAPTRRRQRQQARRPTTPKATISLLFSATTLFSYLFFLCAISLVPVSTGAAADQHQLADSNNGNTADGSIVTMTLAAGASIQHQQTALADSQRQHDTDLDNSIGVSSALAPAPPALSPLASTAGHASESSASAQSRPTIATAPATVHVAISHQNNYQPHKFVARPSQWHQQPLATSVAAAPNSNSIAATTANNRKGASAWQSQNLGKLMKYLSEHQQELVKRNPGSIVAVARGIKLAIVECQYQLKDEPWDCPIYGFSIKPTEVFGMLMSRSFKETSFVQALLSSAIAHAVARACTEGQITTCSRKKDPHDNDFAEDIDFGRQFAKQFMDVTHDLQLYHQQQQSQQSDQRRRRATGALSSTANSIQPVGGEQLKQQGAMWKERRLRYLINAHNDDVGLLTVYNGMMKECKCHGLSGACSMQTCWKRLPKFREVANKLRDSFDQALRVEMYTAPQGGSLALNRHKSMTSNTATINGKLNKKRSSYMHHQSTLVNNPLNGFGRSASKRTIQAAALTSPSALSIGESSNGGTRLQAFHHQQQQAAEQTTSNVAAATTTAAGAMSKGNLLSQAQTEAQAFDSNQYERDFGAYSASAAAAAYSSSTPASPLINNTTMIVRRRPIARSIGWSSSTIVPNKDDLLYAEESPDFCVPNPRYNIKGPKGRSCSESPHASNSCEKLCCGRGYKTEIREVEYRCHCHFKFCCDLICKVCKRPEILHKCL